MFPIYTSDEVTLRAHNDAGKDYHAVIEFADNCSSMAGRADSAQLGTRYLYYVEVQQLHRPMSTEALRDHLRRYALTIGRFLDNEIAFSEVTVLAGFVINQNITSNKEEHS